MTIGLPAANAAAVSTTLPSSGVRPSTRPPAAPTGICGARKQPLGHAQFFCPYVRVAAAAGIAAEPWPHRLARLAVRAVPPSKRLLPPAIAWPTGGATLASRSPRGSRSGPDVGREVLAGEGGAGGDEVGGCAPEDDAAAVVAGTGAEIDDPVGGPHARLMGLDHDDRLAGVDEPVEQAEQPLDVGEVEAGGRLVEDVDAALLAQVGGQLEPLPLAAGRGGEGLAELEVAEPDVGEPVEDLVGGRRAGLAVAEELLGLDDRHREHLADVAAAEVVVQDRSLEPLPLALLTGGGDAGHHRQVGVDHAGAVAVRAGALGVGAEQRRLHAVLLGEGLADRVEQPGVGGRVAASRAADGGLVDRHHA